MNEDIPAFPYTEHCRDGMTLRDYFAAKAMQAYLNDDSLEDLYVTLNKNVKEEIAKNAYAMADVMMKARGA